MAVKGLTALTLADWGKRVDPNGKVDKIIELLGQTNRKRQRSTVLTLIYW
ncbi:hypothetical protein JG592_24945 [Escherichia coli]|nr:hypothetical protein [Escherichia coli]MBJ7168673.1 hypothetical protein [Escherichia coli]